jgi:hypothetical protein
VLLALLDHEDLPDHGGLSDHLDHEGLLGHLDHKEQPVLPGQRGLAHQAQRGAGD